MIRVPSGPCDVKVSRKGREPCWSGDSVVNCILESKKFRWVGNCGVCSALWMTKVSLTNLSQILDGLGSGLKALVLKSSIKRLATTGLKEGIPLQHPLPVCNTYLERLRRCF